ncbi:SusC/RagA family TonB-linked outer membrane protein [Prevotella sp. P5-64]|uniref:SusC/RagA family TonB-linked outer membrane protein n=1 Tax=Prevotella sp. P5-64 TaxID=2024226 RepID=UPI000B971ABE|nr:SusC/RagA family TonB-linked outer membrane protein [Prevotella sp. P5-64]OYP65277.1 SusC/RagA family protein [Prevotella sp. P5-64]
MANGKKTTLLLLLLFCSSLAHAQKQVPIERKDTIANESNIIKIVGNHSNKGAANNALDVLSGQAAGVNVTSNGLDRMAMLNSVRVRGTTSIIGGNDPLVLIDGVTSDVFTLSTIYPADIESFRILKNATETAMYGSRGASGVIEVKTKKGTGRGFQISYEGNVGFERRYKHLEMLNAAEYVATAKALGIYCNNGGFNTDNYKVITRTGMVNNHYLAFSGGTPQSNYRASFGVMDHNTIIKKMDYNVFVAKVDVTQKAFNDRLTGEFGVFGSSFKNHDIFDTQMLFYSAACQNPTLPAGTDENGNWLKNESATHVNPPGIVLDEKNDSRDLNFDAHIKLSYDFNPNWRISTFASYLYGSTENGMFCPTWVWAQGNVYRGEFKKEEWLGNVALSFNKQIGIHRISAEASSEYRKLTKTAFWMYAKGIPTNDFGYNNLGATAVRPYGGTESTYEDQSLASVMGSVTYSLLDRYLLSVNARGDGSSMVGDDNTWGFFPSVSFTWDMKKENFLVNVKPLSMLKLRTGLGQAGNLGGISAYTTMNTVRQTGIVPVKSSPTVTLGMVRNNNPDLRWETKTTFNIGADFGFFANRIMLTAEYYYSKTSDMLYAYEVPVPPFAYNTLLANIGSMSNRGLELGLSVQPISKKDMELNINMNLSFQSNKLISLSGDYKGMSMTAANVTAIGSLDGAGQNGGDNNVVYQIVGQPLGVFYLPHCKGLVKNENGSYFYDIEDLDHNGKVDLSDGGDRYIAGQATPKVTLGSNISFRYKDIYVALQMNGAFGHNIFNGTGLAYTSMACFPDYNVLKDAPKKNIVDQRVSDYWLEKGDYLNFEHLTLGYNVPLKSKFVRSLRVSCNISNLGTITGYRGLTPMINSYVVNSTMGIDDKRNYPLYRTYSLGLSVQF